MHCSLRPGHLLPFKFRAHKKIRTGYIVGHLGGRSKIPLVVIAYQMPSTEDLHLYTCPRNEEETSARQLNTKQIRSMILTEKWGAQHRSCLLSDELRTAKNVLARKDRLICEHDEAIADFPNIDQWYPYTLRYGDDGSSNRMKRRVSPLKHHEDPAYSDGPWGFVVEEKHDYTYRTCSGSTTSERWVRPMSFLLARQDKAMSTRDAIAAEITKSDETITQYHLANQKGGAS